MRRVFPLAGLLLVCLAIGEFFHDASLSWPSIQKAAIVLGFEVILWIILFAISLMGIFTQKRLLYYFVLAVILIGGGAQVLSYLNSGTQLEIDLKFISTTLIGISVIFLKFDPILEVIGENHESNSA